MNDADDHASETETAPDRRRLFEEVRVRLSAIMDSFSDFKMDAAQLRTTTQELGAVAHRIEWLADVSSSRRLNVAYGDPNVP
jgi:hypothetical protein